MTSCSSTRWAFPATSPAIKSVQAELLGQDDPYITEYRDWVETILEATTYFNAEAQNMGSITEECVFDKSLVPMPWSSRVMGQAPVVSTLFQRIALRDEPVDEVYADAVETFRTEMELDVEEPEPFHAYATEPRRAAVLSLPEGTYTLRVRDADGEVVPGSERELVSFGPLDRAVGYVLRPEDRWTRPVISFAPDEAIYTTGRTDLFFQPVPVAEYDARRYTRLFRPQSVEAADPSLTVWTPREEREWPKNGVALAVWDGDAMVSTLPRTPYRVAQLPGASRGYVIEEFAPKEGGALEPDFHAMRVRQEAEVTQVSLLVDGAAGAPVGASIRQVRNVTPPAEALLFLPALLPLAVGVALRIWSRRLA